MTTAPNDEREALDALIYEHVWIQHESCADDPELRGISRAADAIIAAGFTRQRDADGWIACSERMPEPHHGVLTFGRCHKNALVASWDPERDGWFCYAGEPVCPCADITHWRPLPAPPKETTR